MRDTPKDIQDSSPIAADSPGVKPNYIDGLYSGTSDLKAEMARKLGRECYESSTQWLNAGRRAKWNDSLRAFQNLHPSGSKYLSGDYRYRSRLFRPKTRAMVRKGEASTAAAFFSNMDVVNISATDDNDPKQKASAAINQALLQYRLTKTIPWFLTIVGARQDAEVMGICIGKAFWKYSERFDHTENRMKRGADGLPVLDDQMQSQMEEIDVFQKINDHPWVDLLPPENFRFDPGADWRNPIATSPYLIELIPMYASDIRMKIESGEWLPVSESAIMASSDLDDDVTRRSREQGRVPGKDNDTYRVREFTICWVRENIVRWGGRDWHYYTMAGNGDLCSVPKPLSDVYLQGIRPYVCGFILPEAHKTYPSGKVELVRDLQTKANDVDNLRLDNVKLALNPRQFIKIGSNVDPMDARTFNPGKVVFSKDPRNDIVWDRPGDVTASAYQEQQSIDMDFDELVGGMSPSQLQNAGIQKTNGNMELMDGNASQMEEYDQRVFSETFVEPLINQLIKLEQAYETDPVILSIAGKDAQLYQKFGIDEITDELLQQQLTAKVNVGVGATNPKTKLANFVQAGEVVGQLLGPVAAEACNPEEIIKEVFSLCGYKDGERFFQPGFDFKGALQQMAASKGGKDGKDDTQGKIALANATQQAQAQQDAQSRQMDMQQDQQQHQYKMEEMMQKFRLEMEKERMKMQPQMPMMQQPGANITFNAEDALGRTANTIEGMAHRHQAAVAGLHQIIAPIAQATHTIGQALQMHQKQNNDHIAALHHTLQQNHHQNNALTQAIDRMAKAHSAPRCTTAIRDKDGHITHSESRPVFEQGENA